MPDYPPLLTELHQNLNRLLEQETKFGDNAPLELIHQITDHRTAIALTGQARAGEIGEAGWREALGPLLVTIRDRSQANPDWGLSPEDLQGAHRGHYCRV
jgi:hypothetical protein